MSRQVDITNQVFGRLKVLNRSGLDRWGRVLWKCRCSCGELVSSVRSDHLRNGRTKSCGCLNSELIGKRKTIHSDTSRGRQTVEYTSWLGMQQRCGNPNRKFYKSYGGRGIEVCKRWLHSFPNFLADMGRKPSPEYSIDRIDNDGNYEPSNCQWATKSHQARNRRRVT